MTRRFEPYELTVRCRCGQLAGGIRIARRTQANRMLCYCDDCQMFAHFSGQPELVLDRHGGTDILQMPPACLRLTQGREQLACLRLTPTGLLRWYAGCCRTPLANTLATPAVPFLGVIHSAIAEAVSGAAWDATVGPFRDRVFARYAKGARGALPAHGGAPLSAVLRISWRMLGWRLRGHHRPTPFFRAQDGAPLATPRVLDAAARRALEEAARQWQPGT